MAANNVEPRVRNKMLTALKAAGERGLTMAELIDAVYGDREDGGPMTAANTVRHMVHRARQLGKPIACEPRYTWGKHYGD